MSTNGNNAYGKERQNNWNVQRELARFEMEYKSKNRKAALKEHRGKLFWAYAPLGVFAIYVVMATIMMIGIYAEWLNVNAMSDGQIYGMLAVVVAPAVIGTVINVISIIIFIVDACQNPKFSTGKKVLWSLLISLLNWFVFPVYFHKHILYKNLEFEKENFRRTLEGKETLEAQTLENVTPRTAYYSRTPLKRATVKMEERISVVDVHSNMYYEYDKEYISQEVRKYIDILMRYLKAFGSKEGIQWIREHGDTAAFRDVLLLDEFRVGFRDELASVSRLNRKILDCLIELIYRMDAEIPGTKEISALITLFETERELQIKRTLRHIKIMSWVSLFFSLLTGAPETVMLLVVALPPTVASILFLLHKHPIWGVICTVFFFANRCDFSKGTLLSTVIIIAITLYFAYVTLLSFQDRKATKNRV